MNEILFFVHRHLTRTFLSCRWCYCSIGSYSSSIPFTADRTYSEISKVQNGCLSARQWWWECFQTLHWSCIALFEWLVVSGPKGVMPTPFKHMGWFWWSFVLGKYLDIAPERYNDLNSKFPHWISRCQRLISWHVWSWRTQLSLVINSISHNLNKFVSLVPVARSLFSSNRNPRFPFYAFYKLIPISELIFKKCGGQTWEWHTCVGAIIRLCSCGSGSSLRGHSGRWSPTFKRLRLKCGWA